MNRHWYYQGELLGEGKSAVTYRFYLGEARTVVEAQSLGNARTPGEACTPGEAQFLASDTQGSEESVPPARETQGSLKSVPLARNTQKSGEFVSSNQRTPAVTEAKHTLEAAVTRIMSQVEVGTPNSVSVKLYKDDPGNYIPFDQALAMELKSYHELCHLGLRIPQLYGYDEEQYLLVKEFIRGPSGMEMVAQDGVTEVVWRQIIELARGLTARDRNIDYFPANFLVQDGELVYVDYEIHPFDPEWGFEQWGIFYWLNPSGVREFLRTGDGNAINKPGTYKPYDGPELCSRRDELLSRWI